MSVHRLIDVARLGGVVHQPGHVFELQPGEQPPVRRVQGDGGAVTEIAQSEPLPEADAQAWLEERKAERAAQTLPAAIEPASAPAAPPPAGQWCILTATALMDGAMRDPGYRFFLKDGERGPHTTTRVSHDTIDVLNDSTRILGEQVDQPLYEVEAEPAKETVS